MGVVSSPVGKGYCFCAFIVPLILHLTAMYSLLLFAERVGVVVAVSAFEFTDQIE
jgi:hypothetical protein